MLGKIEMSIFTAKMDKDKLHYRIYVSGRVQGVGFRHEARMVARYHGISGIVKNLPDGRVYIEAEGNKETLDLFTDWCRKGPRFGIVESITKTTGEIVGYVGFNVVL